MSLLLGTAILILCLTILIGVVLVANVATAYPYKPLNSMVNYPTCPYQDSPGGPISCPHAYVPFTGDLTSPKAMWAWLRDNCHVVPGGQGLLEANGNVNAANIIGDEECNKISKLAISIDSGGLISP